VGFCALILVSVGMFKGYELSEGNRKAAAATPQGQLVSIVSDARSRYKAANGNEVLQRSIHKDRDEAFCALVPSVATADRWTGRIKSVREPGVLADPNYVALSIEIAGDIVIETHGFVLDKDIAASTNIHKGTELYNIVTKLTPGTRVKFSGKFVPKGGPRSTCLPERSVTMDGSMTEPEFVFSFEQVTPL